MNDSGAPAGSGGNRDRLWDQPTRTVVTRDERFSRDLPNTGDEFQGPPGTGQLLGNRYRLVEKLGQGGMGSVWMAHDEVLARDVAVKEPRLPDNVPADEREVMFARLEREARAAARIDHPSVVNIYDVVSVNGRPWIVMELIRGRTFADLLTEGTLAPSEAARIALSVAGALAAAHSRKVLHRDVKAANIMIGPAGRVVLTDFGIAQIEGEQGLTQTGDLVGSLEYVAPERALGRVPGPESDLFSLGVVLYRAIEGFSPFRREVPQATLYAVVNAEPQKPSQSGEISNLVMRLLDKEPRRRPTAQEIVSALEDFAGPAPRQERSSGRRLTGGRSGGRKWGWAAIAGVTVSVMAGGAAAALWPASTPASEIPPDWTVRNELGASVAAPSEYQAAYSSASGSGPSVTFNVEKGKVDGQILLKQGEPDGAPEHSPEARAEYWFQRTITNPNFADQQVVISDAVVDSQPCKVLTMTYLSEGPGTQLWRKKELYCNSDGQAWKLIVDKKINNAVDTGGEELFDKAIKSFKLG